MANVRIVNGNLVPDRDAVREVATALKKDIESDPKLRERFRRNPRVVLGARGLPADSQRELLRESGRRMLAGDCTVTCITTACCFTCWFTDF